MKVACEIPCLGNLVLVQGEGCERDGVLWGNAPLVPALRFPAIAIWQFYFEALITSIYHTPLLQYYPKKKKKKKKISI